MELATLIGIIAFGILLIVVEVIFVPGTTFVGIGGLLCCLYGIYRSFESYGVSGGTWSIVLTVSISLLVLIVSFKTKSWERFALKKTMDSSFNEELPQQLREGDIGETISSLKPIGKALFEDKEFEVASLGGFIAEKEKIKIIKIDNHKILVEKDA